MEIHPLFAIATPEIIIGVLVLGALLFGADKLPKLARSAGAAKKEFMMGQIEADEATAKAREEARLRVESAHSDIMNDVSAGNAGGSNIPPPTPDKGTLSS
jgi:TatA/E family protein of Tat protein translocase